MHPSVAMYCNCFDMCWRMVCFFLLFSQARECSHRHHMSPPHDQYKFMHPSIPTLCTPVNTIGVAKSFWYFQCRLCMLQCNLIHAPVWHIWWLIDHYISNTDVLLNLRLPATRWARLGTAIFHDDRLHNSSFMLNCILVPICTIYDVTVSWIACNPLSKCTHWLFIPRSMLTFWNHDLLCNCQCIPSNQSVF